MKKSLRLIIGITLGLGASLMLAHGAYADDCESTLYENEFTCASEEVYSYCTSLAKAERTNQKYDIYETIYCNSTRDSEDKIYEAVAEQFQAEDPKWDEDLVEYFVMDLRTKGLEEYLESTQGSATATDKLPANVKYAFFDKKDFLDQDKIFQRVQTAYENQKVIHNSQESLIQQFESREMWANATLSDSPFDLIVDLNLIEIILFGSEANWIDENDVWSWPEGGSDSTDKTSAGTGTEADTDTDTGADTEADASDTDAVTPADEDSDDYTCVPDDTTKSKTPTDTTATSPGVVPEDCGNGTIDGSEECDDGNTSAGDGCSEACKEEEGASLMCKDSDSITFKTFTVKKTTTEEEDEEEDDEEIPLDCDSGSTPKKKSELTQDEKEKTTTQSSNYPGPFIGGVMKNYPESNKTDCPPGTTWAQINIAGKVFGRCFPSQACADFDDMRDFLFGEGWEDDETTKAVAEAVEVSVCVDVKKVKRPQSAYAKTEGCIDCHVTAINDIMDKMLSKNVVPLQNTTQAWGTSNRWGPTFSFNLHVLTGRLKNTFTRTKNNLTKKEEADKKIMQSLQDAHLVLDPNKKSNQPTPTAILSSVGIAESSVQAEEKAKESIFRDMKNYRLVNEATGDQDVHAELMTLLQQLQKSFENLNTHWRQLSLSTELGDKKQCTF